jgi:hypothetical protein
MITQSFPDTYTTPVRIQAKRPNTNKRYKHFTQTHFTIGDEEQFEQFRLKTEFERVVREPLQPLNTFLPYWDHYGINEESVKHTFAYLFQKFKKGIFIQIRQGKVRFLPFSHTFFTNEWHHRITVPEELTKDSKVLPVRYWYANNGLFRYENPCNETDTGMCQMKHMFETLCQEYPNEIPDIDFFVNRRDFPLLKRDLTEPYHHIWDSHEQPLVSHSYPLYAPILSSCTAEGFVDIPIPTMDDWTRIMFKEHTHFAMSNRVIATHDQFKTPWNKKKEMAVFRGSTTGIGYDEETNPRIKLCKQFQQHPYCNVGITSWNTRLRKVSGDSKLHTPDTTQLSLSKSMTLEEQSTYKYIIHVQGHVQAFRLSIELAMGSVILLVHTDYKLWYEPLLEPWEHYVPVSADLSDLDERIQWCIEHDKECQKIAKQAREFYDRYLTKKGCLEYLKQTLIECSQRYTRKPYLPKLSQRHLQNHYIHSFLSSYTFPSSEPTSTRSYQSLKHLRVSKYSKYSHTIFENNNTKIVECGSYVYKQSKFSYKLEHEQFVGLFGTNSILKHIPNFVYTLPYSMHNRGIYLEYIQGPTLFDYIKCRNFNLNQWMFYMIQVFLSLSVGQRICFFNHNDLCSWNIILSCYSEEKVYDYLVDLNQVYRVYTTCIPILIDFDKAHIVYNLQSMTAIYPYQTYQDCICLIVNCVYNIMKFQRLSQEDERKLLYLFRQTICDPIYCPVETVQTPMDMYQFLEHAHKYAHLTFSNKGNLQKRTPMDAFKVFKNIYKPNYPSFADPIFKHKNNELKVLNLVEHTDSVEYRHLGLNNFNSVHAKTIEQLNLHPFLKLYYYQLYYTPNHEIYQEPIEREEYALATLNLPIVQQITDELYDLPGHYLDYLNILLELVHNGGPYALNPNERVSLAKWIQNYLKDRENIYTYSKHLLKFKLIRNIL